MPISANSTDQQPLLGATSEETGETALVPREEAEISIDASFFTSLFWQALLIIKTTLPTALSYDFSFSLFILGTMMTQYSTDLDSDEATNTREAAALTTTFLNTVAFLIFSSALPAVYAIGGALGQLQNKNGDLKAEQEAKYAIAKIPRNVFLWSSIWTGAAIGVMANAKEFLMGLGQNERSAELTQDFLQNYSWFTLTFPARLGIEFMLLNLQDQNIAALIADTSLATFMGLAYYLGFQKNEGMKGFGLAAGAGVATTFVGFTAYLLKKYDKEYEFIKNWCSFTKKDLIQIKDLAQASLPVMGAMVADVSAGFVLNVVAGLTPGVLAVQNYATQYVLLTLVFTASASQVGSMFIANARGKAKAGKTTTYADVQNTAASALLATGGLSLFFGVLVSIFPKTLMALLGGNITPEIATELSSVLPITAVGALLDSLRYTGLNSLRAIGDNAIPSLISSLSLWSGIGAAYWLSAIKGLGAQGIAAGYAAGGALGLSSLLALRGIKDFAPKALAKADGFALTFALPSSAPGLPAAADHV